jgi:hypothetical protein
VAFELKPEYWEQMSHVLAFCHCDKYLRKVNYRKIDLGSQVQRLQSMVTWPHHFGPIMRQDIIMGAHSRANCLPYSGQERGRPEKKRGTRVLISSL